MHLDEIIAALLDERKIKKMNYGTVGETPGKRSNFLNAIGSVRASALRERVQALLDSNSRDVNAPRLPRLLSAYDAIARPGSPSLPPGTAPLVKTCRVDDCNADRVRVVYVSEKHVAEEQPTGEKRHERRFGKAKGKKRENGGKCEEDPASVVASPFSYRLRIKETLKVPRFSNEPRPFASHLPNRCYLQRLILPHECPLSVPSKIFSGCAPN